MIGRRQLPVASPVSVAGLARALGDALRSSSANTVRARSVIAREFGAPHMVLADSGTSALVLALRIAAGRPGDVVALPAYACVDLVAAARHARVQVRLYDVDPETLSPDLDSIRRVIDRGVHAIVVAHLFGYAADVPAVREIAERAGVVVIEDAAQGAGGLLNGMRLGRLGDLAVLSFGRGKGLCAGGGGALFGRGDRWESAIERLALPESGRGLSGLVATTIQWALGRPSLYALPSMLPFLHLGEMVYHDATEPQSMSASSTSLVESALGLEPADLARRRANARALDALVDGVKQLRRATAVPSSEPGFLRYAVRDFGGRRRAEPSLG
ncbi:MAG TPA: DegT/DnrJ/EryC1/StrS family aminotransferase, partial [Gemmatimonadaceae bacterium]